MTEIYRYNHEELAITAADIASCIGYAPDGVPMRVAGDIAALLEEYASLLQPLAYMDVLPAQLESDTLICGGEQFAIGRKIAGKIRGLDKIAVFVCTVGAGLEQKAAELSEAGELMQGYILDTIGSLAAERCAALLQAQIERQAAAEGLGVSTRFSPGYCDWHVSAQHALFRLLNVPDIPVTLSVSAMMKPLKSISGFMAIGKGPDKGYACDICERSAQCLYRKAVSNKTCSKCG